MGEMGQHKRPLANSARTSRNKVPSKYECSYKYLSLQNRTVQPGRICHQFIELQQSEGKLWISVQSVYKFESISLTTELSEMTKSLFPESSVIFVKQDSCVQVNWVFFSVITLFLVLVASRESRITQIYGNPLNTYYRGPPIPAIFTFAELYSLLKQNPLRSTQYLQ